MEEDTTTLERTKRECAVTTYCLAMVCYSSSS